MDITHASTHVVLADEAHVPVKLLANDGLTSITISLETAKLSKTLSHAFKHFPHQTMELPTVDPVMLKHLETLLNVHYPVGERVEISWQVILSKRIETIIKTGIDQNALWNVISYLDFDFLKDPFAYYVYMHLPEKTKTSRDAMADVVASYVGYGNNNELAERLAQTWYQLYGQNHSMTPIVLNAIDTPLHKAAFHGDLKKVTSLLASACFNIDARNNWNRTPLECAIWQQHTPTVQMLITAGANVQEQNSFGNTPLHWAAQYGHIDILRKLIAAGALPFTCNSMGETAIDFAHNNGHTQAEQLLKNYMKVPMNSAIVAFCMGGTQRCGIKSPILPLSIFCNRNIINTIKKLLHPEDFWHTKEDFLWKDFVC